MQQGVDPFADPGLLYRGIPFSFTLLLILGSHEMGHYLVSRRHRLDVTLPYFIPAPPSPSSSAPLGPSSRFAPASRISGPCWTWAAPGPGRRGGLHSVTLVGLYLSSTSAGSGGEELIILGEPLLFQFLSWLSFGSLSSETNIVLHPVAFAGWIGMLVTALNLIPVGQLDGGHVSYALFPDYHRFVSLGCLGCCWSAGRSSGTAGCSGPCSSPSWAGAIRRPLMIGCRWMGGANSWAASPLWCLF